MHHAHQALIVHCDLKPGNILVTPEGAPMLLDFGIAKLLDPASMGISADAAQTRQRAFTPDYASPEQLRGQPVTTATDIYALGVILYALVTGHSPYKSASTGSLADWVRCVCEQDAEPPSIAVERVVETQTEDDGPAETITPDRVSLTREGDPQRLQRRLRGDLDAIVLKALRKNPKDRYGSVDQMAEDIRRHLTGMPVLARKSTTGYVVKKFLVRHKLSVAAAGIVLLSLFGGTYATAREARIAARRFADVRELAHTFLFDVHDAIAKLPGSTKVRRLIATTGTDYLNRLAQDAGGDQPLQLDLADGYIKIGDVEGNPLRSNLGDTGKAVTNYRKALAMAQAVVNRNPADIKALQTLASAHESLGRVLPFRAQLPEGLAHAQEDVKLRQQILQSDPRNPVFKLDLCRAYEVDADVLGGARSLNLGKRDEAMAAYQQALALVPPAAAADSWFERAQRSKSIYYFKIADLELSAGNTTKAIEGYQKSLDVAEELYQAYPNNTLMYSVLTAALNRIAWAKAAIGEYPAAESYYKRSAELDDRALSADPSDQQAREGVAVTRKNLGDLYYYQLSKYPEALASYRRADELLTTVSREDPDNIIWAQNLSEIEADEGSCLVAMNKKEEARAPSANALVLAKQVADRPGATGEQVYNYAWLAVTVDPEDLRDFKTALPYARKAVAMTQGREPMYLYVLAEDYAGMSDYQDALESSQKAVALYPPASRASRRIGTARLLRSRSSATRRNSASSELARQAAGLSREYNGERGGAQPCFRTLADARPSH